MPNDDTEQTRLNIVHQIYLILMDGRLTAAPIPEPLDSDTDVAAAAGAASEGAPTAAVAAAAAAATTASSGEDAGLHILDVGTGPGDWAIEMSGRYPNARIIATDITVFDDALGDIILPNISFQLDDARGGWTYHEPFDLIHLRGLIGAFQDWRVIYKQAFRHLKPGGYIEVADVDLDSVSFSQRHRQRHRQKNAKAAAADGQEPDNSYLCIFSAAMQSAARAAGYPRDFNHLRPPALLMAGFTDVHVAVDRPVPVGLWPDDPDEKTLGKMVLIALLEGLEAYSLRQLTTWGNWAPEDVIDLCSKVKAELVSSRCLTMRARVVTARKPLDSQVKPKKGRV